MWYWVYRVLTPVPSASRAVSECVRAGGRAVCLTCLMSDMYKQNIQPTKGERAAETKTSEKITDHRPQTAGTEELKAARLDTDPW